jgi:hypothetical protein
VALVVRGSDDPPGPPEPPATRAAPPPPRTETAPAPAPEPARPRPLVTGLSERNANLLWSRAARPELPPGFGPWRDRVEALRPRYYRLMVDWAGLQPDPGRPPALDQPDDGCLRDIGPCGEFAGMRDVLRAVRSQQEANGGWEVVVTLYGVPAWAARRPGGCERSTELPRSRPITRAGLEGYRALVRAVLRLAEEEGVELRWWSAWNEPNQPYFLSPQRPRCDSRAPSRAARVYTRLVRALRAELRAAGGDRRLVLGELAGVSAPSPLVTGVKEFVEALPDEIACAGDVWAQHMYAERGEQSGLEGAVGQLRRTLAARACTRGKPIWVTETGVGGTRVGAPRAYSPAELQADCRAMATALRRWARDPLVDAAFQYTFREDTAFPVGLADPGLSRAYPVYELWRAWGRRRGSARACRG